MKKKILIKHLALLSTSLPLSLGCWFTPMDASVPESVVADSSVMLEGHSDFVTSAVFSPNGKAILTTSRDGSAKLWDARKGENLRTFKDPTFWGLEPVLAGGFSRDGQRIALAHVRHIRVWNVEADSMLSFNFLESSPNHVAFNKNGNEILVSTNGANYNGYCPKAGLALILKLDSNELPRKFLEISCMPVADAIFNPDETLLAAAGSAAYVEIFDHKSGQQLKKIVVGSFGPVTSVAFSPDGKSLILSHEKDVQIWDMATSTLIKKFQVSTCGDASAALSPDGKMVATYSSCRSQIKIWDLETQALTTLGQDMQISGISFSPDSKRIVVVHGQNKTASVWDLSQRQ
ncbi:MAG: hypothetical protein NTV34_05665 [Proteobacteria bacterium]|nr:hypothetical protein [Pseudomonadota bacterium]